MWILGVIPFIKLQNDTYTTVKRLKLNDEKWDGEVSHVSVFGWAKKRSLAFFEHLDFVLER